jgi:Hypervirulence associated proteins TUDOR domain
MTKTFKIGDRISWNSEAGRVSGTVIRVHTHNIDHKGYTHHASSDGDKERQDRPYCLPQGLCAHQGAGLTPLLPSVIDDRGGKLSKLVWGHKSTGLSARTPPGIC